MNAKARRFLTQHRGAAIGAVLLVAMALSALAAPAIAPLDPQLIAPFDRLRSPDAHYWFGTDQIGRDVFSRTVYGARVSIMVGCLVAVISILAGLVLGLLAGFIRWVDGLLMRVMDGLMAI
nr:ABC transporter permease [Porphyrobacter sp.]